MAENKDKEAKLEQEIEKEASEEQSEVEAGFEQEANLEADEKKWAELEAKLEEAENRYLRLQADFENVRKRNVAEREAMLKYRSQSLAADLLPALDSFEKALATTSENEEIVSILKGVDMAYKQILTAFEKEGIEAISALDETFDPNYHQAIMQDQDESKESNVITAELQKGYKIKDRVIRPSMVKVNK
ncbi:nucleotide exchange factor GrpE [Listeria sp. PSOL-1]|uniref:nucleotide exchange factor GrpE n=1 Tax=Listeria sp. PSOL-1 TaxID=1844999 RepID=UPI0013D640E7|nr:nucleotide exchange factor GrpE [Listeria sp. PSOL-1]